MKRILTTMVLVVLVLVAPSTVSATTLKIATGAPEGSKWMRDMRAASEEIQQRTDGRVKFKFYAGGVMGNDKSVLRKIRIGQLQGGAFLSSSLEQISPDVRIYSLPFLFRSYDEVDYVRQYLDADLQKSLEDSGYVTFGFAEGGFSHLMSAHPVRSVDDLKGRKIWVPDGDFVSHRVVQRLGLAPVILPITDAMTGLQAGLIEVIGASPIGALAFQWHTRIHYISDTPLVYLYGALVVDRNSFNLLSTEDQEVIRQVMGRVYAEMNKANRSDNRAALKAMEKQGIQIIEVLPEETARWHKIARELTEELRNEGAFSAEIYDNAKAHLREFRMRETTGNLN